MTSVNKDWGKETCSLCKGTGEGADRWDCLQCDGDGWTWVFLAPDETQFLDKRTESSKDEKGAKK